MNGSRSATFSFSFEYQIVQQRIALTKLKFASNLQTYSYLSLRTENMRCLIFLIAALVTVFGNPILEPERLDSGLTISHGVQPAKRQAGDDIFGNPPTSMELRPAGWKPTCVDKNLSPGCCEDGEKNVDRTRIPNCRYPCTSYLPLSSLFSVLLALFSGFFFPSSYYCKSKILHWSYSLYHLML